MCSSDLATIPQTLGLASEISGSLTTGPAPVILNSTITTAGAMDYEGPVDFNGHDISSSAVTFGSDVSLGTGSSAVTIPGGFTVPGSITLGPSSTLSAAADSASSYGQLAAYGRVSLGGAALDLSLDGYDPSPGDVLTIVTDSAGTISGTFAGLPEGSVDTVSGVPWQIHYGSSAVALTALAQQQPQAITFTSTPPSPAAYGGSYSPAATGGGSGNPVDFSIDPASAGCTLTSGTVQFTGTGTCIIDANQAGNGGYQAAPQQQQTFTIGPAPQAISFTAPGTGTAGGSASLTAAGGA